MAPLRKRVSFPKGEFVLQVGKSVQGYLVAGQSDAGRDG